VIHHRQRLPLRFKSRDHLPRVHPQLDDFHRDDPMNRLPLLGPVHRAHPAFADHAKDVMRPDFGGMAQIAHCADHAGHAGARVERGSWRS